MKNGVYYWIDLNRILIVSNVKLYEDRTNGEFNILDWQDGWITTRNIFIPSRQYKLFMYLGEL